MRIPCMLTLSVLAATPCFAQQARPSPISVDSSAAVDTAVDENGTATTGTIIDSVVSLGLGGGFEAIVRPWAQRSGTTGEWNRQVWMATLRYQRAGHVGLRVDGGLIAPPIGLANMMLRSPLNPTIAMPSSLFQPLPALEPRGPRTTLLGALYPYGVSATLATTRWDARAAVIDTTPLRMRRVFARTNPPRFANVVAGGGITPFVGLRVGASVTHGGWQRASEALALAGTAEAVAAGDAPDSSATVVTLESEFAVRYTTVAGEWVRDMVQTTTGSTVTPSGWFVQGRQTLTPRWFAAARLERMSSPAFTTAGTYVPQRFKGIEEIVGYRLTPELTVRAGHRARQAFGRDQFVHAGTVSLVWSRRWM